MKFNKIFKVILLFVFAVYLTGCSGKPVTFNSVDPKLSNEVLNWAVKF